MINMDDTIRFQTSSNKSIIKNKELNEYIKFKLEKEEFKAEDLLNIDEIVLDSKNIIGEDNEVFFEEIQLFPNIKKVTIRNMVIISKDMDLLKNIIDVKFENCELWNLGKLEKVEQLIIINSEIESIEEIKQLKNLKDLQLINLSFENYEVLQNINKLEKLTIKNIKGFSMSKIDFYLPIKYLSLEIIPELNTNIISQYKYLETLSVDRKESKQWEKELNDLKKNGMRILLNDIYYF